MARAKTTRKKSTTRKRTTKRTTKRAPKKAAAKRTTTRRRKTTAKKTAAAKVTKKLKRGAGYSSLNTLTVTPAQAKALGSLMRSHWCKAKGKGKTVCVTKKGVVKAVITHGG